MDAIDNPDSGKDLYANGVHVVERPFQPAKVQHPVTPAPMGGPNFPALEDAEISPVPS